MISFFSWRVQRFLGRIFSFLLERYNAGYLFAAVCFEFSP